MASLGYPIKEREIDGLRISLIERAIGRFVVLIRDPLQCDGWLGVIRIICGNYEVAHHTYEETVALAEKEFLSHPGFAHNRRKRVEIAS